MWGVVSGLRQMTSKFQDAPDKCGVGTKKYQIVTWCRTILWLFVTHVYVAMLRVPDKFQEFMSTVGSCDLLANYAQGWITPPELECGTRGLLCPSSRPYFLGFDVKAVKYKFSLCHLTSTNPCDVLITPLPPDPFHSNHDHHSPPRCIHLLRKCSRARSHLDGCQITKQFTAVRRLLVMGL